MKKEHSWRTILGGRWAVPLALFLLLLSFFLPAGAAHPVRRPIVVDGGRVRQSYLWGDYEDPGDPEHKGLDFSYGIGTAVYAVANGKVVDRYNDCADGTHCNNRDGWEYGNYVLIQHDQQHWNAETRQWSYVYSIYMHLRYHSILVPVGQSVTAGTQIAQVDSTGDSTGDHLHLAICLHPSADRTLVPDTLDHLNTSRNPELWLRPFNSGGTNTGTVVGLYTDDAGNPVGNRYIRGLSKPGGSGGTSYEKSRTYSFDWTNPDDILWDNWATTDVTPGTYTLRVTNRDGSVEYENLGQYTVVAGRTTYAGLYPVYLPAVQRDGVVNSYLEVRNNGSKAARVVATFFEPGGNVYDQQETTIPPQGTRTFESPSGFSGSALLVGSQDIVVVVRRESSTRVAAYTGVADANAGTGWGQRGNVVYIPIVMYNIWGGWGTKFYIQNTEDNPSNDYPATIRITIYFYNPNGSLKTSRQFDLPGRGSMVLDPSFLGSNFWGSAYISSPEPLAVVMMQDHPSAGTSIYNAFAAGANTAYLPSLMRSWYGWLSSFTVQNLGNSPTNVQIRYVEDNGHVTDRAYSNLGPKSSVVIVQSDSSYGVPHDNWHGSARLTASQPIAAVVNQAWQPSAHQSYSGYLGGGSTLYGPFAADYWATGSNPVYTYRSCSEAQNLGSTADVSSDYVDEGGCDWGGRTIADVPPLKVATFYVPDPQEQVPDGFKVSVRLTIEAGRTMAGIHNYARAKDGVESGDFGASYNLVPR